jgi:hypothetical protein
VRLQLVDSFESVIERYVDDNFSIVFGKNSNFFM